MRETMRAAVTDGVLAPIDGFTLPDNFAMFSAEGNRAVREALRPFIPAAKERMDALGLDTFHKRLAAFQDDSVSTTQHNRYSDFFGWAKPEEYNDQGNWLGYR